MVQIMPIFFAFLVNSMLVVQMQHYSNLVSSIGEIVEVIAASSGSYAHAIAIRELSR